MLEDDLKGGVALIFRRSSKEFLMDREFVFTASMHLRWYNYTDAQKFLELALEHGFLKREGTALTPTFDYRKLTMPPGFRPSPDIVKVKTAPAPAGKPAAKETLFIKLVSEIAKKTGQSTNVVIAGINKKRESLRVDAEVLALLTAKEAGIDVTPYVEEAEKVVRERIAQRIEESRDVKEERDEEE